MCAAAATCSLLYLIIRRARMQLRNKERLAQNRFLSCHLESASGRFVSLERPMRGCLQVHSTGSLRHQQSSHVIADGGKNLA